MRMDYKALRDKEFLEEYDKCLKSFGHKAPYTSRREVIEKLISRPAPHFYITYREARRNVRRLIAGHPISCKSKTKLEMYNDLTKMVLSTYKRKPNKDFNDVLFTILAEEKAPRFYLTEDSALILLYKLYTKQRER